MTPNNIQINANTVIIFLEDTLSIEQKQDNLIESIDIKPTEGKKLRPFNSIRYSKLINDHTRLHHRGDSQYIIKQQTNNGVHEVKLSEFELLKIIGLLNAAKP